MSNFVLKKALHHALQLCRINKNQRARRIFIHHLTHRRSPGIALLSNSLSRLDFILHSLKPFIMASPAPSAEAEKDADAIHKACKGMGTNESTLINVLGHRTPQELAGVIAAYRYKYNRELTELMKEETSGDFGQLLIGLATPLPEFEANLIHNAVRGMGTNEQKLIELLSRRYNSEIVALKDAYQRLFHKDIAEVVASETSGDLKQYFAAVLQANKDEAGTVYHDINGDVEKIYKAGAGKIGTNITALIDVIVTRSDQHLLHVFKAYEAKHKKDIISVLNSELSGDMKKAMVFTVRMILEPMDIVAEAFEASMKGVGTNEKRLNELAIRFHGPWMEGVRAAYQRIYGKTISERVHGDTSGDYRKLLLALVG